MRGDEDPHVVFTWDHYDNLKENILKVIQGEERGAGQGGAAMASTIGSGANDGYMRDGKA